MTGNPAAQTGDFTEAEKEALAILADMAVPASAEYGVPGAGDPAIVASILSDAARHRAQLRTALAALDALAQDCHGVEFGKLDAAQRDDVVQKFREERPADANLIAMLTTQCYYRDDRVMLSLGMELRPPHPEGYEVGQGDWSLLDPVRKRAPIFRETR
jgi:hypothetical protein